MSEQCDECGRSFDNSNQLIHHEKSHLPDNVHCLGGNCNHTFKTHGGMLIHMEYGNCESGATRQGLNAAAARLYQWKKLVDPDLRDEMLHHKIPNSQPFFCPECGKWFHKLSALVMHIESPACKCDMEWKIMGRLMGWIAKIYR